MNMRWLLMVFLCVLLAGAAEARDFSKAFPWQHQSRYFDFRFQRRGWDVTAFARFADGFVDLVNRDFRPMKFDYPIQVLVLPDRAAFQAYLRTELGERDPPNFGIYFPRWKLFATYESSGLGTFSHEIMHPLVEHNLPARPPWAVEAIPSFFEKFLGYYDTQGTMVVQWGYQNPWRIEALGPRLTRLKLESLVLGKEPRGGYDTSELRLVSVFLWQQGKFTRLLDLLARQKLDGYSTYFESAMGMRLKEIAPLWQKYLADIEASRAQILRIPSSVILDNKEDFERFLKESNLPFVTPAPRRP